MCLCSAPDERALVLAAKRLGFVFTTRTPETISVSVVGTEISWTKIITGYNIDFVSSKAGSNVTYCSRTRAQNTMVRH